MHARPALSTHPPHPPTPPSSGCRSMPSSAADNSIILHAKTASDVLAQSASHLCEQITSYRKTDFIFEGRCLRYFFPAPLLSAERTVHPFYHFLLPSPFLLEIVSFLFDRFRILWNRTRACLKKERKEIFSEVPLVKST